MSEPLAERLSRFTPDAGKLDRDALLFAAGRASARPGRRWMALAGALAASQLLTLLFLWPRTPLRGLTSRSPSSAPPVAVEPPVAGACRGPSLLGHQPASAERRGRSCRRPAAWTLSSRTTRRSGPPRPRRRF